MHLGQFTELVNILSADRKQLLYAFNLVPLFWRQRHLLSSRPARDSDHLFVL